MPGPPDPPVPSALAQAFANQGFVGFDGVLDDHGCDLAARAMAAGSAGHRGLLALPWCASLAVRLRQHAMLAELIPSTHVAIDCIAFEKSRDVNWLVGLHQDLSVPISDHVPAASLTGWSRKNGVMYAHAPPPLLDDLVAVRVHIDACGPADGPLSVVPGSHKSGRLDEKDVPRMRDRGALAACTMARGGALVMRPLLLHASSKATGSSRRRVLHFVFGPRALPHGLQWRWAV